MSIKEQGENSYWGPAFIIGAAGIVLLRLVIWKFFPGADGLIKEDMSNLIVAVLQLTGGAGFAALAMARRVKLSFTGFEWPLGLMLLASTASLFYTVDFSISIRVWLPLIGNMALFYVLANTLTDIRRVRFFLYFILGCALLTSFFGVLEFFTLLARHPQPTDGALAQANRSVYYILTHRRVTSFLGWPNSLSGYLLLILPFAGFLVFMVRQAWLKCLLVIAFMLVVGCLLVTFSFLGWLSFLMAALIILPVILKRFYPKMDVRLKVLAFAMAVIFAGLFGVVIMQKDFAEALMPRLEYYNQAWMLLKDKFLMGYGYGSFGTAARPFAGSLNGISNYTHNTYLQWWVECGVLGLAGILALVAAFIMAARRTLDRFKDGEEGGIALAVIWGLAAFFIDNLSSFTFIKSNIAVHGWAMFAVFAALYRQAYGGGGDRPFPALGGFLLCSAGWVFSAIIISGLVFFHAGDRALRAGDIDSAGRAFVAGSLIDRWSASYPAAAGDAAARLYQASGREYHLRLVEENYLEAIRREPLQFSSYFWLSRVYLLLGERDKALGFSRQAYSLSPYEYAQDMEILSRSGAGTPAAVK